MNIGRWVCYFSRLKQERLIKSLEDEFFFILMERRTAQETEHPRFILRYERLSAEIHGALTRYHFEEDLVDYLVNLDTFICSLRTELESCPQDMREILVTPSESRSTPQSSSLQH